MSPEERFRAKRANEGARSLAAFFNNLAVGTVVAGFLAPWASGHPEPLWVAAALIIVAVALHVISQVVLRGFLKPEE